MWHPRHMPFVSFLLVFLLWSSAFGQVGFPEVTADGVLDDEALLVLELRGDSPTRFDDGGSGRSVYMTGRETHNDFKTGVNLFVDHSATGANDGSSWCDAYVTLQDALAAAAPGVTIKVADGIYTPDRGGGQTRGDREATFQLVWGVTIEGGYAGCGASIPNQRDIELYPTILSGDLARNDMEVASPDELLDEPTRAENSYHVVTGSGRDETAVLDGLTITAGNANGTSYPHHYGGGMRNIVSHATLTDCTFSDNSAGEGGGGMENTSSSPTLTSCTFSDNSAGVSSGGMENWMNSNPIVSNCVFNNNMADFGAAVGNYDNSNAIMTDCMFVRNVALQEVMHNSQSDPTVTNCTFTGNRGHNVIYNVGSSLRVTDCTFSENTGVAMESQVHSSITVNNCIFSRNEGLAMYNDNSSVVVTGCTFDKNVGEFDAAMYNSHCDVLVTGCAFTGNSGRAMNNSFCDSVTVTDCVFSSNTASGGAALYNSHCNVTLTRCVINDNSAAFNSGGMHNVGGHTTLDDCTFSGNSAADAGAVGIFNYAGTLEIRGTTQVADGATLFEASLVGDGTMVIGGQGSLDLVNASASCAIRNESTCGNAIGIDPISGDPVAGYGTISAGVVNTVTGRIIASVPDESLTLGLGGAGGFINDGMVLASDDSLLEVARPVRQSVTGTCAAEAGGLLQISSDVSGLGAFRAEGGTIRLRPEDGSASIAGSTLDVRGDSDEHPGLVEVAENASIELTGAVTIGPAGVYQRDPSAPPGTVQASLTASSIELVRGPDPEPPAGQMLLTDSMDVEVGTGLTCVPLGDEGSDTPPILRVRDSASLRVFGHLKIRDDTEIEYSSSEPFELHGDFVNQSTRSDLFGWCGETMRLAGVDVERTFEVAGHDLGGAALGFGVGPDSNFSMSKIEVARSAIVRFVDEFDNTGDGRHGGCNEALYVDTLHLARDAIVILDNCRVYYRELIDENDEDTTVLLGCAELRGVLPKIVAVYPPDGSIDPRQPSDPNGLNPTGSWNSIQVTFDDEAPGFVPSDFAVVTTAGVAPEIIAVDVAGPVVTLSLDRSVPIAQWMCIEYATGEPIACLGYLPGDLCGDGFVSADDITCITQCLTGSRNCDLWQCDIDHSGACTGGDLLRAIDLLNGGDSYAPWLSRSLPERPQSP